MSGTRGWKPIATAPRDGSPVDLWRNGERLIDYCWSETYGWFKEHGYPSVRTVLFALPSHWMRPPAPPPEGGGSDA